MKTLIRWTIALCCLASVVFTSCSKTDELQEISTMEKLLKDPLFEAYDANFHNFAMDIVQKSEEGLDINDVLSTQESKLIEIQNQEDELVEKYPNFYNFLDDLDNVDKIDIDPNPGSGYNPSGCRWPKHFSGCVRFRCYELYLRCRIFARGDLGKQGNCGIAFKNCSFDCKRRNC